MATYTRDSSKDITQTTVIDNHDANTVYVTDDGLFLGSIEVSNISSVRNIGELVYSSLPLTDAGLHLLDGSLILGGGIYQGFVDYIADLYTENPSANYFTTEALWQQSVTTYGVCGKFVYDSTNNTVRLPKVTGIIEGTTDVSALGDLVEAGLPNITGDFDAPTYAGWSQVTSGGAVYYNGSVNRQFDNGSNETGLFYVYGFDASLSSSIYGNSTTVQPQTIKAFYYIVIATSTKTDIQVDIDEVATDLNGKADVDLSNINASQSAKNEIIGWGMPDYDNGVFMSLESLSEVSYTCPSDGVITIDTAGFNNNYCYLIINNQTIFNKTTNANSWIIGVAGEYSVSQGDIVKAKAGYGGTFAGTHTLKFFPMKGAN